MDVIFIIGRIILGGFFLMSGMKHFTKFGMLKNYAASKKIPMPGFATAFTGLMLFATGLSILVWLLVLWGALIGVVFLVFSSFLMHNFWTLEKDDPARAAEMRYFMANMSLVGALAIIAVL